MASAIEIRGLVRRFGDLQAVDGIDCTVEQGEIFGFLGPNGAGKTTTISILSTLLDATEGSVVVNGFDVRTQRNQVRRSIGLVFQDPSLDDRLTGEENLLLHAKLYSVPRQEYRPRMEEVLRLVELWDRRKDIVRTFSGGMKRRLEIARGLIHYPAVLVLDEPTIGLDPQTRSYLWEYILKLKHDRGMTIFMSTHYMDEAEYCDRIAIIDHGKIVAAGTPGELKKQVGKDTICIRTVHGAELKRQLEEMGAGIVAESDGVLELEVLNAERSLPRLFDELDSSLIDSIDLKRPTLDDVFLALTGRAIREAESSGKDRTRRTLKARSYH
jgi:ABC-2 type transport system ATP-binding protein